MHHTISRMNAFNKAFKNSKDCYKKMQSWYLANKPKHAFFPMQNTLSLDAGLAMAYQLKLDNEVKIINTLSQLYLYGTWRNTLSIYHLDDEIITDSKSLPDDTPSKIFYNLPDWCVYVDISSAKIASIVDGKTSHIKGFWAIYDFVQQNGKTHDMLNFIIDTDSDDNTYTPQPFIISDELSVQESLDYANHSFYADGDDGQDGLIKGLLPYLLWLCVQEPDVTHKGQAISRSELSRPKYAKNKKTGAFIVPSEPFIYEIGARLGKEIRSYKAQLQDDEQRQHKPHTKRPHIRRGHWHGYWHGIGQAKEFKVKWQPAIFVNSSI